jgi:sugar phosphate isomerase/epimerase
MISASTVLDGLQCPRQEAADGTKMEGDREAMKTSRKLAGIGLAASILLAAGSRTAWTQPEIPAEYTINGFAVGLQANTFNRFTLFEAIEKTAQAGGRIIEFYPGQKLSKEEPGVVWNHDASDAIIAKVRAKLAQHRILAVGYGVVSIPADQPGARKVFEFARKMGLRAITTESTESIDTIEKLVREYDIAVAYHSHPRRANNPDYKVWNPDYIAQLVKGRDRRIGACADTGNWTRSGVKPVEALKILRGRVISAHIKDMNEFGMRDAHEVPYGTGASDVKGCLDELKAQGFKGSIAIEYEYNWDDNVPEVARCIEFVRNYRK